MTLYHKVLPGLGRELYIYYPAGGHRTPFKTSGITVLLDKCDEKTAEDALVKLGLARLADEERIVVSFLCPGEGGWNYTLDPNGADDVAAFPIMQNAITTPDNSVPVVNDLGVPLVSTMLSGWHAMNDVRYLIGVGEGASMALSLAAVSPANIAAVLAVGGELCDEAKAKAVLSPMPVYLVNNNAAEYFTAANGADTADGDTLRSSVNPSQSVTVCNDKLTEELIRKVWHHLFSKVRRANSSVFGDVEPRFDLKKAGFDLVIEDTRLPDGKKHTWFTHVPASVKADPEKKVPVMFFFHGGSDNPHEAAETGKFHTLGEEEGFITVYPWSTNRATWNSTLEEAAEKDTDFIADLIRYTIDNYPVDPTRVYLSGFSNGAAMAQTMAMVHPELIAAICHIDSNWSGAREGFSENGQAQFVPNPEGQRLKETYNRRLPVWYTYHKAEESYPDIPNCTPEEQERFWKDYNVAPCIEAMRLKEKYDYRMPVWYCYGAREPSYPVFKYSTQQFQYDFWKVYNNIEVKETPEYASPHPCGCGVPGDKYEKLTPSLRHRHHWYDVQRFYSRDPVPENYYNYVIMHDKGHEVAHMDPKLGWDYVKHFRRNPDGSLEKL